MGSLVTIQIHVPLEVGLAFGYDLSNKFADQIRAGCADIDGKTGKLSHGGITKPQKLSGQLS